MNYIDTENSSLVDSLDFQRLEDCTVQSNSQSCRSPLPLNEERINVLNHNKNKTCRDKPVKQWVDKNTYDYIEKELYSHTHNNENIHTTGTPF